MTAEQRAYLKREVDAKRRLILAQAGDRKFQQQKVEERMNPLLFLLPVGMAILMTLALLVESWA